MSARPKLHAPAGPAGTPLPDVPAPLRELAVWQLHYRLTINRLMGEIAALRRRPDLAGFLNDGEAQHLWNELSDAEGIAVSLINLDGEVDRG